MEIIDVSIYDPTKSLFKSKASEPAECRIYLCSNKDNCSLYKINKCIQKNFFVFGCPYGKVNYEKGPTKRARTFFSWLSERKTKYNNTLSVLSSPESVLAKVGEYFYLPYPHMFLNLDVPVLGKATILSSGRPFVHENDFNVNLIIQLLNHRPQSLFGGEITSYQKKELPLFLKHLSEQHPEMFKQVSSVVDIKKYIDTFTNIGRKALLSSLLSGTIIEKDQENWLWDGEYLTSSNSYLAFTPVTFTERFVKIKPVKNAVIKITNENQVCEGIVFLS